MRSRATGRAFLLLLLLVSAATVSFAAYTTLFLPRLTDPS